MSWKDPIEPCIAIRFISLIYFYKKSRSAFQRSGNISFISTQHTAPASPYVCKVKLKKEVCKKCVRRHCLFICSYIALQSYTFLFYLTNMQLAFIQNH